MKSISRAGFYHLGSLALGSFILAVVWMIKIICEYLMRKATPLPGQQPSAF